MGDPSLRVLVNLTWLVPGVVGGSEESTTDALRAVLEHHPEVQLHLAVLAPFAAAHPDLANACRCEVLDSTGANKVARVMAEQTWLARRATALAPDVVHHAGGVVPLRHPGHNVVTIHDLQPLDLPENFSTAKSLYLRSMLGRSARAAEVVCVPSEFTSRRVVDLLGVPASKVQVVPWSVVSLDRVATPLPTGVEPVERAVAGHPVFLYPAITHPHKNHAVVLDAFARVLEDVPEARLVLAGGEGASESAVLDRMAAPDLVGRVVRPGRVDREEMEHLYHSATAVLVPSLYEGFGLPALEAMSRGVPLAVSSAGSLPEVVSAGASGDVVAPAGSVAGGVEGGAAALCAPIDPQDTSAWAEVMLRAVTLDDGARIDLARRARLVAAAFSPRRTADALVQAYLRAAGRGAIA